ncbi:uncharacterized protein TRUGW13939_10314 [Talaromyces rugulosus]|uniref:Cytochrome P450 n=1 Tax=Talaromyces rugulosus TaxID=121627 RepID=A0A7H8RCC4_TALRU|nr:uncharacterized protein TRUGW13939_10314 [Talaromyces rugulosus]QKX63145.1 hypothetical protein TRUGW13939_10314 [Talaromyces rugulosus]
METPVFEKIVSLGGSSLTAGLVAWLGIASLLVYVLSRHSAVRKAQIQKGCHPVRQYPRKDPILGLDYVIESVRAFRQHRFLATLQHRHKTTGTTFGIRVFRSRGIFTIDPKNIQAILSTRFKDYSLGNRSTVMGPLLGRGIFVTDGPEWAHSRALLRPHFVKDQLVNLSSLEGHIRSLLGCIPDDRQVDLQELFLRFTLDTTTDFLFGNSADSLAGGGTEEEREFGEAFRLAMDDITLQFRMGPFSAFRRVDPKVKAAYRTCRTYVDIFVDRAIAKREKYADMTEKGGKRDCFLDELATTTADREKMRDELLSILLAGRDTTASLLSSLFHVLARRPDVWQKVRREAAGLKGKAPTYAALQTMKYAKHVINEVLRLYPPVPNNRRVAVRDTVLPRGGGPDGDFPVFVPKGSLVLYSVYAMHRHVDLFGQDAEEFRPERWDTTRCSWEYLPFNGGPRTCLGQQYALTEALYVLLRFAQVFQSIETQDTTPWTESLTLTVCSANGVHVTMQRVKS